MLVRLARKEASRSMEEWMIFDVYRCETMMSEGGDEI